MRLATVRSAAGPRVALAVSGDWMDLADAASVLLGDRDCPSTLVGLLRRDGVALATAHRLAAGLDGARPGEVRVSAAADAALAPPVADAGAFLDFYAFEEHVRRARARRGQDVPPEWYRFPVYYRSNQRSFVGHGEEVCFPAGEARMDYELELAAVLGEPLESPTPERAAAAIAGYCLLNDWSARSIQAEVMKVGLGPARGKDFAASLGPWLVTADELGDPALLTLEARVNGERWSRGRMSDMRWSFGELIAFAGEGVRFEPGDVFGSGTVGGGCGLEFDRYLSVGDVVELDGGPALGVLANTVRQREGQR
jgi:fumarylacetoacetate (FAA) hydrolase